MSCVQTCAAARPVGRSARSCGPGGAIAGDLERRDRRGRRVRLNSAFGPGQRCRRRVDEVLGGEHLGLGGLHAPGAGPVPPPRRRASGPTSDPAEAAAREARPRRADRARHAEWLSPVPPSFLKPTGDPRARYAARHADAILIADRGDTRDAVGLYLAGRGWTTLPLDPDPEAVRAASTELAPGARGDRLPRPSRGCHRVPRRLTGGAPPVYLFNAPEAVPSDGARVIRAAGPAGHARGTGPAGAPHPRLGSDGPVRACPWTTATC